VIKRYLMGNEIFMAKVSGPLELKWRSTHGGVTGQQSRMGKIMRSHFTVHKHQWFTRAPYNMTMAAMLRAWRDLTSEERELWEEFSLDWPLEDRYGGFISIGGFQWFLKLNSVARLWAANPIYLPPNDPVCDYNPTLIFTDTGPGGPIVLSADVGAPAFARVIVRRKINLPISTGWFPNPLNYLSTLSFTLLPAYIVAEASEIDPPPRIHFFSATPFDEEGRQGTETQAIFSRE